MDTKQLKQFCNQLPGATSHLHGHPSNVLVYSVGDKNFAWFKTSDPEKWRFSFRVTPERFIELTDVPGIKPARYMARYHWVTIVDVRSVPAAYLTELVEWSYHKALASLSKTHRAQLTR
ncbi:MAG: MmcQ/YjbR family DNA-binding protein [Pseudomonadota bacterium]|nr:MmcQ/YjbR family DNA-binding protein [Pseudomonadota bacterium]